MTIGDPPVCAHPEGHPSYAQQGEDLIIRSMFTTLGIERPSYIDIGAHEPIANNNTYLFYERGARGVLVEPNPFYADLLRKARPGDAVLEHGIGQTHEDTVADYYVVKGDGQLNTFSKEQADEIKRTMGADAILRVEKLPLVNVNKVLAKHFPNGGPDLMSIDTEGLDLSIHPQPGLRALPPPRGVRGDEPGRRQSRSGYFGFDEIQGIRTSRVDVREPRFSSTTRRWPRRWKKQAR